MLNVAHVMGSYLAQSETFIWQYLKNFENVRPIVIASLLENIEQFPLNNSKLFEVSLDRWTKTWFKDNYYRRFKQFKCGLKEHILQKERIEIIHAHFGGVGCEYVDIAYDMGIPLVTTFYGYDLSRRNEIEKKQKKYQRLFEKGKKFLVEGPSMRDKLISIGCPEEKISIQRIAIDLQNYNNKKHYWDGKRKLRLLFVGRFVEKKGLDFALQALSLLKDKFDFVFRIVGYGENENKMQDLGRTLGIEERIDWLGKQPHSKVIKEIEESDVLIQPSVTASDGDSEGGAPTIILEAQACGSPVVSTLHGDIPYITARGESALLSRERNVKELRNNIQYFFDNPAVLPEMGKKGRQHIEKHHDVRKEITFLEEIYQILADKQ